MYFVSAGWIYVLYVETHSLYETQEFPPTIYFLHIPHQGYPWWNPSDDFVDAFSDIIIALVVKRIISFHKHWIKNRCRVNFSIENGWIVGEKKCSSLLLSPPLKSAQKNISTNLIWMLHKLEKFVMFRTVQDSHEVKTSDQLIQD